jgi:hypothetical protein
VQLPQTVFPRLLRPQQHVVFQGWPVPASLGRGARAVEAMGAQRRRCETEELVALLPGTGDGSPPTPIDSALGSRAWWDTLKKWTVAAPLMT